MPTYTYKCNGCSRVLEVQHGMNEIVNLETCECGWDYVKVFTPAGIVFKGSGFYSTDRGGNDK